MPTMTDSAAVAAGATVANACTGKLYEFIGQASMVSVGLCGSALGLTATIIVGTRTLLDNEPISGANRFPVIPDDFIVEAEPGLPGERVTVKINNPTAGALTYYMRVDVQPV